MCFDQCFIAVIFYLRQHNNVPSTRPAFGNKPKVCAFCNILIHFCIKHFQKHAKKQGKRRFLPLFWVPSWSKYATVKHLSDSDKKRKNIYFSPHVKYEFEYLCREVWGHDEYDRQVEQTSTLCSTGQDDHRNIFDQNDRIDQKLSNESSLLCIGGFVNSFWHSLTCKKWRGCTLFIKLEFSFWNGSHAISL